MTGYNINQDDLPWWATAVLNWIGMAQAIGEGHGKQMHVYRGMLRKIIDVGPPEGLYKVYKQFETYQKQVADGFEDHR